jgi:hypothetical protein
MLWDAVENYSDGKILKTKDERESDYSKPQEEQTTYLVAAAVKSKPCGLWIFAL